MIIRPEDPSDDVVHADVVVVGTGAGGAVVAAELAEAGARVVVVEEGDHHPSTTFTAQPTRQIRTLYRDRGLAGAIGNTFIGIPLGRGVGGTTTINSGTCWRAPEEVLRSWEADFGIPDLAGGGLSPEYQRVEKAIHVDPVPDSLLGPGGEIFRRGAQALGLDGENIPRNAAGCRGTGVCALGCPHGAKQSTNVSYMPRAIRAGARVYVRTRADRVLIENGRAVGVLADRGTQNGGTSGGRLRILAGRTVVAAGALLTPLLLKRSRVRRRPIGHHLRIHPAPRVLASFDWPVRAWEGVPQSYHVHEFEPEGIFLQGMFVPPGLQAPNVPGFGHTHKERMAAYDHLASFGALISDTSEGRVLGQGARPLVWYWLNRHDVGRLRRGIAQVARIFFAAGAREVYPGVRQLPVLRSLTDVEELESTSARAGDIDMMAFHPMGTARMGRNPNHSAVAPSGEVHGLSGLYVADASLFPGSTRLNPQLTIMALATRIARGIAERKHG